MVLFSRNRSIPTEGFHYGYPLLFGKLLRKMSYYPNVVLIRIGFIFETHPVFTTLGAIAAAAVAAAVTAQCFYIHDV